MGCQTTMATPLFCFACNSIQRLNAKPNYFEIFNLAYRYDLDLEELENRYQKLSMELHPDFYISASSFEKKQSQESSTLLNHAYSTLRSPIARAEYLLKLLAHEQRFDRRQLPNGFLEKIFLLQESLEDWLTQDPHSPEVKKFRVEIEKNLDQIRLKISSHYAQLEKISARREEVLPKIQLQLNAGRYFQSLLDRINRRLS